MIPNEYNARLTSLSFWKARKKKQKPHVRCQIARLWPMLFLPKKATKIHTVQPSSGTCITKLPQESAESLSLWVQRNHVQPEVTVLPNLETSCSSKPCSFCLLFFSFPSLLFVRGRLILMCLSVLCMMRWRSWCSPCYGAYEPPVALSRYLWSASYLALPCLALPCLSINSPMPYNNGMHLFRGFWLG